MSPTPATYRLVAADPLAGPLADETLIPLAAQGPVACLWQADQGLVVPRTYAALPGFAAVQSQFAQEGWPVTVRQSGGGVVPQGPGILNISLAQVFAGRPLDLADAYYRHLCRIIAAALRAFGIESRPLAVQGSFCDGRYNLALGEPARKIVGTAQAWRHRPELPAGHQVGLVHALILADCDPIPLTARANALEIALGTQRRYDPACIASMRQCLSTDEAVGLDERLQQQLHTQLQRHSPLPSGGC